MQFRWRPILFGVLFAVAYPPVTAHAQSATIDLGCHADANDMLRSFQESRVELKGGETQDLLKKDIRTQEPYMASWYRKKNDKAPQRYWLYFESKPCGRGKRQYAGEFVPGATPNKDPKRVGR